MVYKASSEPDSPQYIKSNRSVVADWLVAYKLLHIYNYGCVHTHTKLPLGVVLVSTCIATTGVLLHITSPTLHHSNVYYHNVM